MQFADDAALTAHTKDAPQHLISCLAHACSEFGLTISLKKTNILGQDVSSIPSIFTGLHTLEMGSCSYRLLSLEAFRQGRYSDV